MTGLPPARRSGDNRARMVDLRKSALSSVPGVQITDLSFSCHPGRRGMVRSHNRRFDPPALIHLHRFMGKKALSTEPLIHDSANVRDSILGAYTEVGARTQLLEVLLADYSYVVNGGSACVNGSGGARPFSA